MQYTSKVALLAIALFGTSALAVPFASEADYDVEAREVENDLEAREFDEMYVEARDDLSLDARDLESMDLETREYLEYLEARAAATASAPQSPLSPSPSTPESTHRHSSTGSKHGHVFLTKHQKYVLRAKKLATKKFENKDYYHSALIDRKNKDHHFAVLKYLHKPKNLNKALKNKKSPYYRAAKHVEHQLKAKAYLSKRRHYRTALKHRRNKYHADAVRLYLSHGNNFEYALVHKSADYHKYALRAYLLDNNTRMKAIANENNQYHESAVRLQKKIEKLRKQSKLSSSSSATPKA